MDIIQKTKTIMMLNASLLKPFEPDCFIINTCEHFKVKLGLYGECQNVHQAIEHIKNSVETALANTPSKNKPLLNNAYPAEKCANAEFAAPPVVANGPAECVSSGEDCNNSFGLSVDNVPLVPSPNKAGAVAADSHRTFPSTILGPDPPYQDGNNNSGELKPSGRGGVIGQPVPPLITATGTDGRMGFTQAREMTNLDAILVEILARQGTFDRIESKRPFKQHEITISASKPLLDAEGLTPRAENLSCGKIRISGDDLQSVQQVENVIMSMYKKVRDSYKPHIIEYANNTGLASHEPVVDQLVGYIKSNFEDVMIIAKDRAAGQVMLLATEQTANMIQLKFREFYNTILGVDESQKLGRASARGQLQLPAAATKTTAAAAATTADTNGDIPGGIPGGAAAGLPSRVTPANELQKGVAFEFQHYNLKFSLACGVPSSKLETNALVYLCGSFSQVSQAMSKSVGEDAKAVDEGVKICRAEYCEVIRSRKKLKTLKTTDNEPVELQGLKKKKVNAKWIIAVVFPTFNSPQMKDQVDKTFRKLLLTCRNLAKTGPMDNITFIVEDSKEMLQWQPADLARQFRLEILSLMRNSKTNQATHAPRAFQVLLPSDSDVKPWKDMFMSEAQKLSDSAKSTSSSTLEEGKLDPRYKTALCTYYMSGSCGRGDKCSFAHSQAELSQRKFLPHTYKPVSPATMSSMSTMSNSSLGGDSASDVRLNDH